MRMISFFIIAAATGCGAATDAQRPTPMLASSRLDADPTAAATFDGALSANAALDRSALIDAVLVRNPDVERARQAWRAAIAVYPSAGALDDPMISYEIAPLSIVSDARFGQRIAISQKLPFPGKRRLAGEVAIAEADVLAAEFDSVRLALAETAVGLFDDYYLVARALEINSQHRQLLESMHASALAQYSAGRGSAQDPLEAEVALVDLERDRLMLETQRDVAVSRLNGLLHRPPDALLPPPPATLAELPATPELPSVHPTQLAAEARIHARTLTVERTERDFYPDLQLMASYDSMWDMPAHQWMVGVAIEIPLQRGRRRATVEQAQAAAASSVSELAQVRDTIAVDLAVARRQVAQSRQVLDLYDTRLLPAARDRVDAALAGFTSGQNNFSTVMVAERALRDASLRVEQQRADLDRQHAALDRAMGRIPGGQP